MLAASIAAAGTVAASILLFDSRLDSTPGKLAVIYVGADDCGPCITWRSKHRSRFLASPEFRKLGYREIIPPALLDLKKDEYWPEDLAGIRNEFNRLPGAPVWFVIREERILLAARGLREWEEIALPRLKSLVR